MSSVLLSSCERGADVIVTGSPFSPDFEMKSTGLFGGGPPDIDSIVVVTEIRTGVWRTVWSIESNQCTPVSKVQYGQTPRGFVVRTRSSALEPGRVYEVDIMGCGYNGGSFFKIAGDRIMCENGTGDEPQQKVVAQN